MKILIPLCLIALSLAGCSTVDSSSQTSSGDQTTEADSSGTTNGKPKLVRTAARVAIKRAVSTPVRVAMTAGQVVKTVEEKVTNKDDGEQATQ